MSKQLGMKLKTLRLKAKLTQSDIATACKFTTPQFISNWERGISRPPLERIQDLADVYKVGPRTLIDMLYDDRLNEAVEERRDLYRRYL